MLLLFQSLGCATIIVKLSWKCKVCKIDPGEEVTTKPKRCHFHPSPFSSKIKTLFCILSLHCIRMNSWFANPDHKLLLCHMGKHGSTTWARFGWYCAFLIYVFSVHFPVTSTTCTLDKSQRALVLPCRQEPGGEILTSWFLFFFVTFHLVNNIILRWEDAAYSPKY